MRERDFPMRRGTLSVSVPEEWKYMVEKAAQADGKTVAALLRQLINEWLKSKGYEPPKPRY